MKAPNFQEAMENGEIIEKDGYHQPQNAHFRSRCPCKLTTDKGAYRDVTVKMPDGRIVHFYHQSPIAVEKDGKVMLDNHGYKTSSTKERINRYSPYRIIQRDFDWYVRKDGERIEFRNGMILEK
jgi:hypothetical protein